MSTPHDYYDECGHMELDARGETAMYEDPDRIANDNQDQLPLVADIGAGPRGDGVYVDPIVSDDNAGTFKFGLKNDRTDEQLLPQPLPNLHAGHISIEFSQQASDIPNGDWDHKQMQESKLIKDEEATEGRTVKFYNTRNGNKELIATTVLPEGAHGTRVYVVKSDQPIEPNKDFIYTILTKDLYYQDVQIGDHNNQPVPRVWDIVLANIIHPIEHYTAFSAGLITHTNEATATILFRSISKFDQVQVDYDETNPDSVRYIQNRQYIETNRNKVSTLSGNVNTTKYPNTKCLNDEITEEASKRAYQDGLLQDHIDAEKERAETAETNLAQAIETEASKRRLNDGVLADHITAEKERAQAAEATKVDKSSTANIAYTTNEYSQQSRTPVATTATSNTLAKRKPGGTLEVATPVINTDAATKEFVNNTVATETAHLITKNGLPFTDPTELPTTGVTNNDYAYVIVVTTEALKKLKPATILKKFKEDKLKDDEYYFTRYKYTVPTGQSTGSWGLEFTIKPGFTTVQWAAINSGINTTLVEQITVNADNIAELITDVEGLEETKQDKLPTIVNNRFLHTNASTGNLEWSEGGAGTYVFEVENYRTYEGLQIPKLNNEDLKDIYDAMEEGKSCYVKFETQSSMPASMHTHYCPVVNFDYQEDVINMKYRITLLYNYTLNNSFNKKYLLEYIEDSISFEDPDKVIISIKYIPNIKYFALSSSDSLDSLTLETVQNIINEYNNSTYMIVKKPTGYGHSIYYHVLSAYYHNSSDAFISIADNFNIYKYTISENSSEQAVLTIAKESLNNKLNKTTDPNRVLGTDNNGNPFNRNIAINAAGNSAMVRDAYGRSQVANPSAGNDIANKSYVDNLVGITKTTLDAIATANTNYYLGEQSAVSIVLPSTISAGQWINVVFYSGTTASTLSITGATILGDIPTPEANQRIELSLLYDGTNWALLSNVMETV